MSFPISRVATNAVSRIGRAVQGVRSLPGSIAAAIGRLKTAATNFIRGLLPMNRAQPRHVDAAYSKRHAALPFSEYTQVIHTTSMSGALANLRESVADLPAQARTDLKTRHDAFVTAVTKGRDLDTVLKDESVPNVVKTGLTRLENAAQFSPSQYVSVIDKVKNELDAGLT